MQGGSCVWAAAATVVASGVIVSRRLIQGALVLVAILAAAQLIRPARTNPPTDPSRSIQAHLDATSGLGPVLQRSCDTCHSNETVWPPYSGVAPLSWVVVRAVAEGRRAVNFSDWGGYPPDVQRKLLSASCSDARNGRMPGSAYTLLYPEARLSVKDIDTICAAAQ